MGVAKTKREYNQDLVNSYLAEVKPETWEMKDVARWVISQNLWDEPPESKLRRCAKELSDACREEYETDPQGRRTRSKLHYAEIEVQPDGTKKQRHFWARKNSCTPRQARMSFGQQRKQVEGQLIQIYTDIASYNDNNINDDHFQMSFDFTDCVEDSLASDEYDPS